MDVIAAVTLKEHDVQSCPTLEEVILLLRYVVERTKVRGALDYLARFLCPDIGACRMPSDALPAIGPKIGDMKIHDMPSQGALKSVNPFRGATSRT